MNMLKYKVREHKNSKDYFIVTTYAEALKYKEKGYVVENFYEECKDKEIN